MVFINFQKIVICEKISKNLDFGIVFGSQNREKSRQNCVEIDVFFLYRFFIAFFRFFAILARFWEASEAPKIDQKSERKIEKKWC